MKVELVRKNNAVHIEAGSSLSTVKVQIDGSAEVGGEGLGVRPMELLLMALGSCSAIDFVNILKKQRQVIDELNIQVEGKRADTIPAVFTHIHLVFNLSGAIEFIKANKAADLAIKKYCSVYDMLSMGGVEITHEVVLCN